MPFLILSSVLPYAQNIGIGTATPAASAALEIKASNKGILVPRTSSSSRNAITSPAKGLQVYDTTTNNFWFYNAAVWKEITSGSIGWNLSGNTGTNPATHFIGTTDAKALRIRVNNVWAGEMHPTSGNVYLGISSGSANTTGEANTGMGEHALRSNTEGGFNTASG